MKANELREKSVEQLNEQLLGLLRDQFNLRIQKANWPVGAVPALTGLSATSLALKLCSISKQVGDHG